MAKAAPRLTKVQAKALGFIRSSLERTGTAPTLRELCSFMEYSAIGSAQDLVAALRRKGFLLIPQKQSARSLVLSPKALALHEPTHQSTEDTYVVSCYGRIDLENTQDRVGTLRFSVALFERPYPDPETLVAIQCPDNGMSDVGLLEGDYLVISKIQEPEVESGDVVLILSGDQNFVRTAIKDRQGFYFRPENSSFPILKVEENGGKEISIIGKVIASQRIFSSKGL